MGKAALSEPARAQYLGPQAWLDTIYPPLLAATLILAFHLLLPPDRRWLRAAAIGLALLEMAADLAENALVRTMLLTDQAAVSDAMIARANAATLIKSGLVSLLVLCLLILLAQRFLTRRRRP